MNVILRVVGRYAPIVTFPVAVVLGFIGYTLESHISSRQTPSLQRSINEEREERLLSQAQNETQKSKNIFERNDPKQLK